jgi:hypothetical protein
MPARTARTRHVLALVIVLSAAFAVLLIGCGGDTGTDAANSVQASSTDPIVGEWQRTTTCAELVEALERAGLDKLAPEAVAGTGFVPGVTTPEQLADPARPCKGAVPRRHSHFFTQNGQFGSRDWNGEQVDDGTYVVNDGGTLVISKEFPDVTFHYEIRDGTITFHPVIADGCLTFRCMWSVAVAYPGKKWKRVS